MIFQTERLLNPRLRVATSSRNLSGSRRTGHPARRQTAAVDQVLKTSACAASTGTAIRNEFSGGQQQRIGSHGPGLHRESHRVRRGRSPRWSVSGGADSSTPKPCRKSTSDIPLHLPRPLGLKFITVSSDHVPGQADGWDSDAIFAASGRNPTRIPTPAAPVPIRPAQRGVTLKDEVRAAFHPRAAGFILAAPYWTDICTSRSSPGADREGRMVACHN